MIEKTQNKINQLIMKKFLLSIFAVMLAVFSVQAQVWTKVTDASTLQAGDKVVIVAKDYNYAIGKEQTNNNRSQVAVTKSGNDVSWTSGVQEIELQAGTKAGTFAFYVEGSTNKATKGYLYAASSSSNYLRTQTTNNDNGSWTISIAADGTATVKAQGTYTRNVMQYNQSSGLFACYSSASQKAICIYKYTEAGGTVVGKAELPNVSVANNSTIEVGTEITITPAADNNVSYKINGGSPVVIRDGEPATIIAEQAGTMTLDITTVCLSNDQQLSATYTYTVKPVKPSIVAESTSFEDELEVEINADGDIYYTLDGTEPTTASTVYSAPFTITETTTVKAIAVSNGVASDVAEATFTWIDPNVTTATLSFASTAQRTSFSTSQQVWEQNGVKLTNDKGSGNNIADYANPARFYKNTNIKIEALRPISKIEFDCVSDYVISISGAIKDGTKVTVNVNPANTVYEVKGLSAQVRLNSLTVTYANGDSPEPVVTAAPTLPASANFENEFEVAITAEDGAAIYYTTDGTEPTTASTVYSTPFTITETTTVKAIAVKNEVISAVAEATYTKVKLIDLSNCTVAEAIEAYKNGQTGAATITGYIVGAADGGLNKEGNFSGSTTVKTNLLLADDPSETDVTKCIPVELPKGDIRDGLNLADNSVNYKKKVVLTGSVEVYFSVAGLKSVSAYEFIEEEEPVAESWSSFYAAFPVAIPEGVEAYIVTAANAGYVTLTQIYNAVPVNTGVILKGGSIEATYDNYYTGEVTEVTGNLLNGTMSDTYIYEEAYVLGKVDGNFGFYKAAMNQLDGTAWLANAGKAYLPVSALPASAQGAASFSFRFEEGTTGISEVKGENGEVKAIFDLTGRRVEAITAPGIYVVNGKKVLVK